MQSRLSLRACLYTTILLTFTSSVFAQSSSETPTATSTSTPTSTLTTATTTTDDHQIQCLRFPPLVVGNQTFDPSAITALSTAIGTNSYDPPLSTDGIRLSPGSSSRVGWAASGGFQVCVQNFWFFRTVTVPLDNLSEAVSAMGNACCDDEDDEAATGTSKVPGTGGRLGKCQDMSAVVKAVDGSEVRVVSQDYGDSCCGMWGC